MGKLLKDEHVLLVGVQHVTGMWVLRGMRMKSYFAALRVKAADAAKFNGIEADLQDAQQLAIMSPAGCLAISRPGRKSRTEITVSEWAKEMEQQCWWVLF